MREDNTGQAQDVMSVGTRISWGAIFAGVTVAVAMQFLLGILGTAVGVSITNRVDPSNLRIAALVWTGVVTCTAVFVGGMVTSQFTAGENKMEAMLYGIIMWTVLIAISVGLGGVMSGGGFHALLMVADRPDSQVRWDDLARGAGVPAEQIEEWRRKTASVRDQDDKRTTDVAAARTRLTWSVFGGVWLSMFAAVGGAVVGAGPAFRIVGASRV